MPDPNRLSANDPQRIGAYRLVGVLGEGGQGTVYLGQTASGRRVAVKVLHTRMAAEAGVRERFEREAALARRVAVFCTAQVLEAGVSDGRPYLVSEYVPGPSLQQLVTGEGPRTGSGLERLAVATATALAAIHRVGIVHRDFKPANVIMGPEGPVVIDFGIARILEAGVTSSALVGSPGYMAPEQLSDQPAGPPSDMFAWAATMVYAATGHPAFTGQHPAAVMNAVMGGEPNLNGVPRGLHSLLVSCLAKDPAARPTADQVLATLTGNGTAPGSREGNGSRPEDRTVPGPLAGTPVRLGAPGAGPAPTGRSGSFPGAVPDDVTMYGTAGNGAPHAPTPPPPYRAGANPFPSQPGKVPGQSPSRDSARPFDDRHTPATFAADNGGPAATASSGRSVTTSTPTVVSRRRVPAFALATAAAVAIGAVAGVVIYMNTSSGTDSPPAASSSVSAPPPSESPSSRALFTGHARAVNGVAVTELDGRRVVVSGSGDQTVRIWDLATGEQIGQPITDPAGPIFAIAVTKLEGRPVVVTGGFGAAMRVWDLTTGKQLGRPLEVAEVSSLAVTDLNGRPVVLSGSADEAVRVWDLTTGERLGRPFEGHESVISTLAVAELDGRPIAVSGSFDKTARIWDLTTGKQIGRPITDNSVLLSAVTVADMGGRQVVVTGGEDNDNKGFVWVWDLATGSPIGQPFKEHTDTVTSVVVTKLGGRTVAITGSSDKTVRIWDLATREPIGKPLTGHDRGIHSIAVTELDGRPVIVTGSGDGTIRVWDLPASSGGN
ncbi:protein kinase domain-containing protein [Planomonospora algeriensis]